MRVFHLKCFGPEHPCLINVRDISVKEQSSHPVFCRVLVISPYVEHSADQCANHQHVSGRQVHLKRHLWTRVSVRLCHAFLQGCSNSTRERKNSLLQETSQCSPAPQTPQLKQDLHLLNMGGISVHFLFLNLINLFKVIYLSGATGSCSFSRAFSGSVRWGLLWLWCSGVSLRGIPMLYGAQALGRKDFSSWGTWST